MLFVITATRNTHTPNGTVVSQLPAFELYALSEAEAVRTARFLLDGDLGGVLHISAVAV